ncbi:MAG TPA: hypothetical protein VI197_29655 [Polyangiaceae bacterium]
MSTLTVLLAPAVGDAAVVYRTSGVACRPETHTLGPSSFMPDLGLVQYVDAPVIGCWIPTGEATVTPSTLEQVNIRYHVTGASTVAGRLILHDYASHDYVECGEDVDVVSTAGFGQLELEKSCNLASYTSSWGVVSAIETTGLSSGFLTVKLVTVHD